MKVKLTNGSAVDLDEVQFIGPLSNGQATCYTLHFSNGDKRERSNLGTGASSVEELREEHAGLVELYCLESQLNLLKT